MRTIDTAKRDKVIQTVLQITMEEGLAALSFDKLAKRAGISSGTPYVYYKDKTDLLIPFHKLLLSHPILDYQSRKTLLLVKPNCY